MISEIVSKANNRSQSDASRRQLQLHLGSAVVHSYLGQSQTNQAVVHAEAWPVLRSQQMDETAAGRFRGQAFRNWLGFPVVAGAHLRGILISSTSFSRSQVRLHRFVQTGPQVQTSSGVASLEAVTYQLHATAMSAHADRLGPRPCRLQAECRCDLGSIPCSQWPHVRMHCRSPLSLTPTPPPRLICQPKKMPKSVGHTLAWIDPPRSVSKIRHHQGPGLASRPSMSQPGCGS